MLRSRISWTCVIGVIVSMPVDGIILYNAVKYWAPATFGFGLHKVKWANSPFQNGVHKLQHVSVSTLDSGIQLLAQINPYADNLWRLLTYFKRTSLNNAFDRHFCLTIYGSVNFKRAHSPPGICGAFVALSVPAVGICQKTSARTWSIFSEEVNVVLFSIFYLKIWIFRKL